ncbi:MAG: glycosyltransferase family 87 protein [Chloroflexota bacterium]
MTFGGGIVLSPRGRRVVQAVALGFGIGMALISIRGGIFWTDGQVYWLAAERLQSGEPLYPVTGDPEAAYYKYAPWFAWAWVPLTYLPEPVVAIGWTLAMLSAWASPLPGVLRIGWRGRAVVFLAAPPLLVAALGGNIQPAVVAALWAWLDRRWGPAAVGFSASLQVFPILFAVLYAARRQWWRAGVAIGLAAILWLPALAYGIADYPEVIGGVLSLWRIAPFAYIAVVIGFVAWTWLRRSPVAASLLVLVATSARFIPYHLGYLLCSWPRPPDGVRPEGASSPRR